MGWELPPAVAVEEAGGRNGAADGRGAAGVERGSLRRGGAVNEPSVVRGKAGAVRAVYQRDGAAARYLLPLMHSACPASACATPCREEAAAPSRRPEAGGAGGRKR
jgi:hypothetical protein